MLSRGLELSSPFSIFLVTALAFDLTTSIEFFLERFAAEFVYIKYLWVLNLSQDLSFTRLSARRNTFLLPVKPNKLDAQILGL